LAIPCCECVLDSTLNSEVYLVMKYHSGIELVHARRTIRKTIRKIRSIIVFEAGHGIIRLLSYEEPFGFAA